MLHACLHSMTLRLSKGCFTAASATVIIDKQQDGGRGAFSQDLPSPASGTQGASPVLGVSLSPHFLSYQPSIHCPLLMQSGPPFCHALCSLRSSCLGMPPSPPPIHPTKPVPIPSCWGSPGPSNTGSCVQVSPCSFGLPDPSSYALSSVREKVIWCLLCLPWTQHRAGHIVGTGLLPGRKVMEEEERGLAELG